MIRNAVEVPLKLEQPIVNDINTVNGSKHFWKLFIGENGLMQLYFRDVTGDRQNYHESDWKWFDEIQLELPRE